MPAKVLQIVNGEFYAGAERVQDVLSDVMVGRNVEMIFAVLKSGKFMSNTSIDRRQIADLSRFSLFRRVLYLKQLCRDEDIEILHSHSPSGLAISLVLKAATPRLKIVHHQHSNTMICTDRHVRNCVASALEFLGYCFADRIIFVSGALREQMFTRLSYDFLFNAKADVVHNSVQAPDRLPSRLNSEGSYRFVCVAMFRKRKGIGYLLRALKALEDLPVHLTLVGDFEEDSYRQECEKLVGELGLEKRVTFLGFVTEIQSELVRHDAMVFASVGGEGMPMVLVEAMVAELPIVSTSVEGVLELLGDQYPLICFPSDVESLSQAMRQCIVNSSWSSDLGSELRKRYEERFSPAQFAARIEAIYFRLLHP